jgi:hypothetical protein
VWGPGASFNYLQRHIVYRELLKITSRPVDVTVCDPSL